MDWLVTIILIVGIYYILDLAFSHRERMAQLKNKNKNE